MATLNITRRGRDVAVLTPEKRLYPIAGMPTTEAAIQNGIWRDLYVVIGDRQVAVAGLFGSISNPLRIGFGAAALSWLWAVRSA